MTSRPILARRRFLAALLAALLLAAPASAAEWLVAFEALPDDDAPLYATRAERTAALISELGPAILVAAGRDAGAFDAEITPGGYQTKTNPAVLLALDTDEAGARRLAAACGYVFDQQSVLAWRETDGPGTLLVTLEFPGVTPNLADHFFRYAASLRAGLGGGFTARDNRLLFLNLRGPDGVPLSGLVDEEFAEALRFAAQTFGGTSVSTGRAVATLVESASYAGLAGPEALPVLDRLRARRVELIGRR